jgi:hypothetical protein
MDGCPGGPDTTPGSLWGSRLSAVSCSLKVPEYWGVGGGGVSF